MMSRSLFLVVCFVLLLSSCGRQYDAEKLVEHFMDKNMKAPSSIHGCSFSSLDSTRAVTDSLLQQLRQQPKQRYQQSIQYEEGEPSPTLLVTRVKYYIDTTQVSDTYYLDAALTRVVAFKEN